jgi:rhodanese-related sulfurtransferase
MINRTDSLILSGSKPAPAQSAAEPLNRERVGYRLFSDRGELAVNGLVAVRRVLRGVAVMTAVFLAGCGLKVTETPTDLARLREEIRARFPAVRTVSTAELAEWIERPTGVQPLLLDARAPAEFAVSHLPGAILAPSAAEAIERLRARTNAGPVVFYCSVGYRSAELADQLQTAGFTNLFNLEGSIFQWANEGRPLFRGKARVEVVHPFDDDWGRLLDRRRWSFEAPTR